MNKIDLIIENIEYARLIKEVAHQDELLEEALAAARELRELKPVAYMDSRGVLFNKTTHPQLNIPLYALGVTK
jgi:enoyl-CoA hydratase/carnithine racemase